MPPKICSPVEGPGKGAAEARQTFRQYALYRETPVPHLPWPAKAE